MIMRREHALFLKLLPVCLGFSIVGAVYTDIYYTKAKISHKKIEEKIKECEKDLPRNQYCRYEILTYPVGKGEE